MLYCAEIVENSLGPAGRKIHAHRTYFEDGVLRLIVGSVEELTDLIPSRLLHDIVPVPKDNTEPTITVEEYLYLAKTNTNA